MNDLINRLNAKYTERGIIIVGENYKLYMEADNKNLLVKDSVLDIEHIEKIEKILDEHVIKTKKEEFNENLLSIPVHVPSIKEENKSFQFNNPPKQKKQRGFQKNYKSKKSRK